MFETNTKEEQYVKAHVCYEESHLMQTKILELLDYIQSKESILDGHPGYPHILQLVAFAGLLCANPILSQDEINKTQLMAIDNLIRQISHNDPREKIKSPEDLANFLIENAPEEMKGKLRSAYFGQGGAVEYVKTIKTK